MADDAGTEVGMSFLCDTIIPLGPRIQGTFQLNANIQTVLIYRNRAILLYVNISNFSILYDVPGTR